MLVLEYLGLSPTTTTDSEFITSSFTDMSNGSRGSEDAPSNSTTTTTNVSRAWSRPRSDISNNLMKTNLSFQSSKMSSVEQESLDRRRTFAKAALAGIPYVSKEQLNQPRHADYMGQQTSKDLSTLLKLQRSVSAPVDFSNSHFSLFVNTSTLTSNQAELGQDRNGSELDSDSETLASSSTPSSARAFSPNMSRADSEDSREYSSAASLGILRGSTPLGGQDKEELLGNII